MCTQTIYGYIDVFSMKYKQHPNYIGMCTQTIYGYIDVFSLKYKQHPNYIGMCTQTIYEYIDLDVFFKKYKEQPTIKGCVPKHIWVQKLIFMKYKTASQPYRDVRPNHI